MLARNYYFDTMQDTMRVESTLLGIKNSGYKGMKVETSQVSLKMTRLEALDVSLEIGGRLTEVEPTKQNNNET